MTPPGHKSETLRDLITGELEDAVDQACDINFLEDVETKPIPKSVDESRRALNLFPTRGAADTLTALSYRPNATSATIVTNPLDEEQQQKIAQEKVAKHQSRSMAALQASRDYTCKRPSVEKHFNETIDQTLALWIIGREATSPEDIAIRTALRKQYLEPDYMSRSQYKARLVKQARGASVPAMRGVPIILAEGEEKGKEDKDFVRWVHKARHFKSMYALRASASVADVRLERRLRFDYAKLKARYQIKSARARYAPIAQHVSASATHVAASSRQAVAARLPALTNTVEKRHRSQDDPEQDIQKRQRCKGNLAAGVSQTPMTSLTQDTHVTSPDTDFDHGDDAPKEISPHGTKGSFAYQLMPAEAGVSVKVHAELLQEVNGLRETLTQTQSALDAVQTRLQTLEQQQLRLEGQLDILIRMLQPATKPYISA